MNWTPELITEAQAIYDGGDKPTRVAEKLRARYKCKLTTVEVRSVLKLKRHARALQDGLSEEILRIKTTEHLSNSLVAERLGIPNHTVNWVCRGIKPPAGATVVSKSSQREEKPAADAVRMPELAEIEIPSWVPEHLHELYEHTAQTQDEHVAARVCRDLKRGHSVSFTRGAA